MNDNTNGADNSSTNGLQNRFLKISIYNEKLFDETGELTTVELSLPATQMEVQAALSEIGVDGKNYSRYLIDGCESGINGLADCLPENADIDELNYLSTKIHLMDDYSLEILGAMIEKSTCNLSVVELINTIDNADCYNLQPAFNAKLYGEFLLEIALDEMGTIANEQITDSDAYGKFMSHFDEIEKFVDAEKYGRRYAEMENGIFTDYGYLTQIGEITEHYKGKENLPEVYKIFAYPDEQSPAGLFKIENTDLTDFIYKLHIYGGNLISQAANNIPILSDGKSEDYIVHLRHTEIRITDSDAVYHDNSDSGNLIKMTYGHTKAFMLHIDSMENNRAFGSIVMSDCAALAEDIGKNTISYVNVTAYLKDSSTQEYSREQWEHLILMERDNVDSHTFNFNSDDVLSLRNHCQEFFGKCLHEAKEITPNALLDMLNAEYMALANQPQSDMVRVPLETAKNMLLYSDGPVHRLTPHKPEQLTAITAAKNGLMFPQYRDFAVKHEERRGIDKLCNRETNKLLNEAIEQSSEKKRNKTGQEH